ncbi:MAG: PadR family transcriptional regulator [Phycisphaerales bacterium]|nr:MAG: PadR family transcriptional regulator [Phycisphaerales bacterium]
MHGYELKAAYESDLAAGTTLNAGQVYQTLDRLLRDGLVTVRVVEQSVRPDRKVYTITDAGRASLAEWLASPDASPPAVRDEMLIKLLVARRLSRAGVGDRPPAACRGETSDGARCGAAGGGPGSTSSAEKFAGPNEVLRNERRACMARLHEINAALHPRQAKDPAGGDVRTRLLLELAALRLEAQVKWLDRCEAILRGEKP